MRPHHKLEAWKKSVDFVVKVYKATESFPMDEKFGLDEVGKVTTGLSNHLKGKLK